MVAITPIESCEAKSSLDIRAGKFKFERTFDIFKLENTRLPASYTVSLHEVCWAVIERPRRNAGIAWSMTVVGQDRSMRSGSGCTRTPVDEIRLSTHQCSHQYSSPYQFSLNLISVKADYAYSK